MRKFVSTLTMVAMSGLCSPAFALSMQQVNEASPDNSGKALVVRIQILLDRAGYSPGQIDGLHGDATDIAIKSFQADHDLPATGKIDRETFGKLSEADSGPVLTRYVLTRKDAEGPFVAEIPDDIAKMGELDELGFSGPRELLAEKFHMDEDLLVALNPKSAFDRAEQEIVVAEIRSAEPASAEASEISRVVVDKSERTLRVFGKDDRQIALYPATIGSKNNPAPSGELKVVAIAENPTWTYKPELELEGYKERPDHPVEVKAGPNNPVGLVWIDLDKEHYGIHGTPDPAKVGKSFSSGCVRLTNWDAIELAGLIRRGTPVLFQE